MFENNRRHVGMLERDPLESEIDKAAGSEDAMTGESGLAVISHRALRETHDQR